MTLEQVLGQAYQLHQAGRLAEAAGMYRQILAQNPKHADALHLLGLLARETGRLEAAEDLIRKALAVQPQSVDFHINLGIVLTDRRRWDEAITCYRQALALKPDSGEGLFNLGIALANSGRLEEALAAYRQAVVCKPDMAEACIRLAELLFNMGRTEEAAAVSRQALNMRPDSLEACNTLGNLLCSLGREEEALEAYFQALTIQPENATVYYNAAVALKTLGKRNEAEAAIRRALALKPDFAEALVNLGAILVEGGRLEEAITVLKQSLAIRPDFAEALNTLGKSLKDLGRIEEAYEVLQRAVAIKPDYANSYNTLGNILLVMGRVEESLQAYRRAVELEHQNPTAQSNLVFAMNFDPRFDAAAILREARQWNERHAKPLRHLIRPHENTREANRRLRVGYVSADFREHVVAWNLLPLLGHHDPEQVEVFCYSSVTQADAMTEQLRAHSNHWRDVSPLNDERLAALVRDDRIDLLIDLSLHSSGNRLRAFAMAPAPVQITYLGYCGTSGIDAMRFRLSDPHLDPPQMDLTCYSEQTIRLPQTYWCYAPGGQTPEPSPPPVLGNGHITFGCMNQFTKVSSAAMELWCEILKRVPRSRLLVHALAGKHLGSVSEHLDRQGIAWDRVEFVGRQPWDQYTRTYHRIDIGLDPFPYNGGITTCDTLWMGVAVVSLSGPTAVGRAGRSILYNLGLADLVANDPDQYVRLAVDLAGDLPKLSELRQTLRDRMKASPLMDAPRFARNVEAAYRDAWRRWCAES
ncbi:MAG: tetratricopeptide repeat protein [Tepidisphaeraceae bacterium]